MEREAPAAAETASAMKKKFLVVFSHLRRLLASYFDYYHRSRTHLSLNKDAPASRPVMSPEIGEVVGLPEVGGLHTGITASPPDLAPAAPAFVDRSDKLPTPHPPCPPRPPHLFSAVRAVPGC